MLIIPFRDPAQWTMQIELSQVIYFLTFTWNALNEFWTMDIANRDQIPVLIGIKIVPSYPLLSPYSVEGQPIGQIICQNIVNAPSNIGRFDMSQKFELVYYEPGELEALIENLEI